MTNRASVKENRNLMGHHVSHAPICHRRPSPLNPLKQLTKPDSPLSLSKVRVRLVRLSSAAQQLT